MIAHTFGSIRHRIVGLFWHAGLRRLHAQRTASSREEDRYRDETIACCRPEILDHVVLCPFVCYPNLYRRTKDQMSKQAN